MEKIKFLILIVLYKLSPEQSDTLKSLSQCKLAKDYARILILDNSPKAYDTEQRRTMEEMLDGFAFEYRHNRRNEYLSTLYNQTIQELQENEYLILLDHDSQFDLNFLEETKKSISAHPEIDLFLPLIYCDNQLVSPSRMVLFKGKYLNSEPTGVCAAHHAMAINSGMVISGRYLRNSFPGYDERFHFYCTDCDFMWKYARQRTTYCVIPYRIQHSLEFYGFNEPYEKKVRRFREMRNAFLIAMRDRSLFAYWLCHLYMDVYSIKFALQHHDRRFLFVR